MVVWRELIRDVIGLNPCQRLIAGSKTSSATMVMVHHYFSASPRAPNSTADLT